MIVKPGHDTTISWPYDIDFPEMDQEYRPHSFFSHDVDASSSCVNAIHKCWFTDPGNLEDPYAEITFDPKWAWVGNAGYYHTIFFNRAIAGFEKEVKYACTNGAQTIMSDLITLQITGGQACTAEDFQDKETNSIELNYQ